MQDFVFCSINIDQFQYKMSDYLSSLSYHSGKAWDYNANNYLQNISITAKRIVFSIPRKKMKSNASTFGDWDSTPQSQAFRHSFVWFLDWISHVIKFQDKNKPQIPGDEVEIFFEHVTGKSGSVGERIHVFTNRAIDHGDIIKTMLKQKQPKKMEPWHLKINSIDQLITNVLNPYIGDNHLSYTIHKSRTALVSERSANEISNPINVFSVYNFKIEGAREIQNNFELYERGFPDEKAVVKRMWTDLEPSYLWGKYLPSHQFKWVDLPEIRVKLVPGTISKFDLDVQNCPAKCLIEDYMFNKSFNNVDEDDLVEIKRLAKGRFIIHEVRTNPCEYKPYPWITGNIIFDAKAYDSYGSESMEYTERLKSRFQNQHSISAFDIIEMETTYRMEVSKDRRKVQELMVDKFVEQCVSGDSDISAAGKAIARWVHHIRPEIYEKHGSFEFEMKDPSLSPFANMQFWVLQGFDMYLCVASAHPELLKLHYAAYDAYRQHGENELHWNMIYTGEGATSKSFVFETKKKMSIDGTITEVTYQTTRADAVDGDQNDHVTIFNESPPGLFAAGKNNQNEEALAMMKEKLTSNRTRTKTLHIDKDTGERKNRIAISSQIGVYMGATNDNPAEAEEAVKTRFHWGEFEKIFRQDRCISDYQKKAFDMESKPELLNRREEFLFYTRDQQMKVFYVWKFIFCKIIKDVSLDASATVLSQISGYLKREHQIRIPPRTVERYRILCRILTITNALDLVFNFKGGKHNGKPFELVQLLDIEPLLYCTEELAVCAMNMVAVEIPQLTISRDKTIKALWKIFKNNEQHKKDRAEAGHDIIDYSYARFTGGLKPLCQKIQNMIPFSEGKPSLHNIFSVLKMLGNEPFMGRKYATLEYYVKPDQIAQANPSTSDTVTCNLDGTPVEGTIVLYDETTDLYKVHFKNQPMPGKTDSIAYIPGQNFHDIHMDLFTRKDKKTYILTESLSALMHRHTKPRKIVTGVPKRENGCVKYPQFLDIIDMTTGKRDPPKIKNSNQETEGIQTMMGLNNSILGMHTHVEMDVDVDTYAWHCRCELLGIQGFEYHMDSIENNLDKSTMSFPTDLTTKSKKSISKLSDNIVGLKEFLGKRKRPI